MICKSQIKYRMSWYKMNLIYIVSTNHNKNLSIFETENEARQYFKSTMTCEFESRLLKFPRNLFFKINRLGCPCCIKGPQPLPILIENNLF